MTQDEVLRCLAEQYPNKPTQRQIAGAVGKSASTVNEQLRYLEKKGLIFGTGGKGKNRRYVASPEASKQLADEMTKLTLTLEQLKARVKLLERDVGFWAEQALEIGDLWDFLKLNNPTFATQIEKARRRFEASIKEAKSPS